MCAVQCIICKQNNWNVIIFFHAKNTISCLDFFSLGYPSSCLLIAAKIVSAIFHAYSFNGLMNRVFFGFRFIVHIVHVAVCIKHYCIIQIRIFEWNDTKDYIVARLAACSTCFIDAELVDECIKYLCVEIDVQKSNLHKSNDTNIRISCSAFLWSSNPFISSVNRNTPHYMEIVWTGVKFILKL